MSFPQLLMFAGSGGYLRPRKKSVVSVIQEASAPAEIPCFSRSPDRSVSPIKSNGELSASSLEKPAVSTESKDQLALNRQAFRHFIGSPFLSPMRDRSKRNTSKFAGEAIDELHGGPGDVKAVKEVESEEGDCSWCNIPFSQIGALERQIDELECADARTSLLREELIPPPAPWYRNLYSGVAEWFCIGGTVTNRGLNVLHQRSLDPPTACSITEPHGSGCHADEGGERRDAAAVMDAPSPSALSSSHFPSSMTAAAISVADNLCRGCRGCRGCTGGRVCGCSSRGVHVPEEEPTLEPSSVGQPGRWFFDIDKWQPCEKEWELALSQVFQSPLRATPAFFDPYIISLVTSPKLSVVIHKQLNEDERKECMKFVFEKDRKLAMGSRLLQRFCVREVTSWFPLWKRVECLFLLLSEQTSGAH